MMLWNACYYAIWCLLMFVFVSCYPTGQPDRTPESDINEEKLFPNGTVIGRYSYVDKDGNPIQVKYYADEASYGVELKSIKVVDPQTPAPLVSSKEPNSVKIAISDKHNLEVSAGVLNPVESGFKDKTNYPKPEVAVETLTGSIGADPVNTKVNIPLEYLNKINRHKIEKSGPYYDVYYQNELQGTQKYGKEKVHVYFDKDRNMRSNVRAKLGSAKYCEQF